VRLGIACPAGRVGRVGRAGEPVEIQPANHLSRGVVVPAGQHRVGFAYRPRRLTLGIAASGLGAGVLLVPGWRGRRGLLRSCLLTR